MERFILPNFSVEQSLMKAKSYANKGDIAEAQKLYETILKNFSNNLRAQQGLASLKKYNLNQNRQSPPQEVVDQLVNLYNQGQFAVVAEQAEVLTKQYPTAILIWNILGASRSQIGMLEEAIAAYKKTISLKPDYVEAYSNMGVAYRNMGKPDEAIDAYKKAISIYPYYAEAYNNLGNVLQNTGQLDKAIAAYKKVSSFKPNDANVHYNLAAAFKDQGNLEEAIKAYNKTLKIKPDHAEAYNNLGIVLKDQGKLDEAIDAHKQSILLKPLDAKAYFNLGNVLREQLELDEAIEYYCKSISIKPDYADAYNNIGTVYHKSGRLEEAETNLRQAIFYKPEFAEAHQNLSFTLLNNGKLREGFDESEWRWKTDKFLGQKRNFPQPLWDGKQSLNGKRILLWCEQGVGDTIMWSSKIPFLTSQSAHCILECQEKLVPLLTRSFPDIEVKAEDRSRDIKRDDFDYHLPMGSLYRHFVPEITENPKPDAYLVPDPVRVNYWKERLKTLGKGPYIGISWKSSNMSVERLPNYSSISEWSEILSIPNVTFINLQSKDFADDLAKVREEFGITVHHFDDLDQWNNIDDVAALCTAIDMVISNHGTVPLISGGVGTVTKLANWRQSPWNNILNNPVGPSVDIFERDTLEPWDKVFKLIKEDITKLNLD